MTFFPSSKCQEQLSNSGLSRSAAEAKWYVELSLASVKKDQRDAADKDGKPLGKAG